MPKHIRWALGLAATKKKLNLHAVSYTMHLSDWHVDGLYATQGVGSIVCRANRRSGTGHRSSPAWTSWACCARTAWASSWTAWASSWTAWTCWAPGAESSWAEAAMPRLLRARTVSPRPHCKTMQSLWKPFFDVQHLLQHFRC
jgi:hypothetical protein